MPDQIGSWNRLTTETAESRFIQTLGISSKTWEYKSGPIEVSVAFDYPFRGYHDVTICYTMAGWTVVNLQEIKDPAGFTPVRVEALMQQPQRFGELWFATLEENGRPAEILDLQGNFFKRWRVFGNEATTYRVQVLVTGYVPLTPAEHASVTHFFEDAGKILTKQLVDQTGQKQ